MIHLDELFTTENAVLENSRDIASQNNLEAEVYRDALLLLTGHYQKMMRESYRLISRSDRAERELTLLNEQLLQLAVKLEYEATHDPLTDVYNRSAIINQIGSALQEDEAALILLDIDHFKAINDNYGHPTGDAVFCGDRGKAIDAMALAFKIFLSRRQDLVGVIGLGGSGGTALITPAMQALPVGVPKVMVSTMASGDVAGYVGASDISMVYSVTDVAGLNRISRRVLGNAAHQVAGAVLFETENDEEAKPALGLTMFGVTTPCIQNVSAKLEKDYDCLVFHATGSGGRAMEKLTDSGMLSGLLDLTTTEVCDLLFGGVLACDETRFDAVAKKKIPCVISCGALDMVNFGHPSTIPAKYAGRLFYHHNAQVTLMRTTPEENVAMAKWIADKLNRCEGEVVFLIPLGGFSALDAPEQPFWSPDANQAFITTLEATLLQTARRKIVRLPYNINHPEFAQAAVQQFRQLAEKEF